MLVFKIMETKPKLKTPPSSTRLWGTGFALGSMFSSQLGAAAAVPLMLAQGSFVVSALRLTFAALCSLILFRPNVRQFSRRQWHGAVALGIIMALTTLCYFMAVAKIPVGAAITIDYLGPLGLAIISLKGWPRLLLPFLATFGVVAMSYSGHGWLFAPSGALFALVAALGWAGYIILLRHVGQLFSGQDGLCLSLVIASLTALPIALIFEPTGHWFINLSIIAGLALLFPLIPYALELLALRRVDMGVFSILMSLEPAIGALLGFLVLHQTLSLQQSAGVLAVMAASMVSVTLSPAPPDESSKPA